MGAYLDVDEVKDYLNMVSDAHDEELQRFIQSACSAIERYRDETIGRIDVTESYRVHIPTLRLQLGKRPIVSITAIENESRLYDEATLCFDSSLGIVRAPLHDPFIGRITVSYVAGFPEVPPDWRHATLVLVDHLWSTQRRSTMGRRAMGDDQGYNPSVTFSLPHRVTELVGPPLPGIA